MTAQIDEANGGVDLTDIEGTRENRLVAILRLVMDECEPECICEIKVPGEVCLHCRIQEALR